MDKGLLCRPGGFDWGLTRVLAAADEAMGIDFSILRLRAGEVHVLASVGETCVALLSGTARLGDGQLKNSASRASLFDERPSAIHVASGAMVHVEAVTDSEFTICGVANPRPFASRFFGSGDLLEVEDRGKGMLGGAARREVRTIFDWRNRPESEMMLGEVITYPGLWSSYPPHHHSQPEIYHYRFTQPQGYGHAELGERVFKVRSNDTLLIQDGLDHPQVAAPAYGMYYFWIIRHLPGDPYRGPVFTEEHRWANDPRAEYWHPKTAEH